MQNSVLVNHRSQRFLAIFATFLSPASQWSEISENERANCKGEKTFDGAESCHVHSISIMARIGICDGHVQCATSQHTRAVSDSDLDFQTRELAFSGARAFGSNICCKHRSFQPHSDNNPSLTLTKIASFKSSCSLGKSGKEVPLILSMGTF